MLRFCNYIVSKHQSLKPFLRSISYNQKLQQKIFSDQQLEKHSPTVIACIHNLAVEEQVAQKENVQPVNKFVSRTHTCGELRIRHVGNRVRLCGWMEFQRLDQFLILRDSYGSVQLIVPNDRQELQEIIKNLTFESVLNVTGIVNKRPEGTDNKQMKTGDIEIIIESLEVLNEAKPILPLHIRTFNKAKENTQMKHRYIALRYPDLQKNLRLRSQVIAKMREYLIRECDFVDIETPTLFKNTPGGAQEFIVPTRHPGQFYSLVQSPQQFKQLLMVGGFDRYFQVARCYRDESGKCDRQPEFTQLDIEMSFVDCEGIMELTENLLMYCWPEELEAITRPFKRLTYNEAMELYGTDKPDLRIPQQLYRLTEIIGHTVLEQSLKIKWEEDFEVYALVFHGVHEHLTGSFKKKMLKIQDNYFSSVRMSQLKVPNESSKVASDNFISKIIEGNVREKLNLNEGDVLFLACGQKHSAQSLLGRVRLEFTNLLENYGKKIRTPGYELLWITDFPLFSFDMETNQLNSSHHPFTQPHLDDIQFLSENPIKVRGLHYDLVINGSEIAGGSIRIHKAELQKRIFKMLKINESYLTHMLEALDCGAPPHGGIALGLDRLLCLLCKTKNIQSVIAFPKSTEGRDMMSGAPVPISNEEKILYHIQTIHDTS